jgi:hypothetical protein
MRVVIKASDVAVAIGQSRFKTPEELKNELWKKYRPETFTSKTKKDEAEEALGRSDVARFVFNEATAARPQNSTETQKVFLEAKKKIQKDTSMTKEDKDKIVEHIRSKVYTSHGTRNEDRTADKTGLDLQRDDTFYTHQLAKWDDIEYIIMGRVDRIEKQPDGSEVLVEIKNRTKGLLRALWPTEEIQIQTYLHMLDLEKAKLIEQYNDQLNTITVSRDRDQWENIIEPDLENFCRNLHSIIRAS